MTRIEERMIRAAADRVRGMTAVEAVEVLFREGLLSPRRCEQAAIRDEIARLERSGIPRCEAFQGLIIFPHSCVNPTLSHQSIMGSSFNYSSFI